MVVRACRKFVEQGESKPSSPSDIHAALHMVDNHRQLLSFLCSSVCKTCASPSTYQIGIADSFRYKHLHLIDHTCCRRGRVPFIDHSALQFCSNGPHGLLRKVSHIRNLVAVPSFLRNGERFSDQADRVRLQSLAILPLVSSVLAIQPTDRG